MSETLPDLVIPDRASFKATEVCELLKVQPYVLRSWESEFKDLGIAKAPGGPRVYRRRDVERAALIKHYVFGEGLTLAGVRRRFEQERPALVEPAFDFDVDDGAPAASGVQAAPAAEDAPVAQSGVEGARAAADPKLRASLAAVRDGLRELQAKLAAPVVVAARERPSAPQSRRRRGEGSGG